MKEWRKVTFMKEWLKALDLTVILCYRDLLYLFSFRSYGRLKKKKCRYKQISFTKSLLLLKGHFQSSFIFPFQCSITHVRGYTVVGSVYYLYQRSLSLSLMVPERIGNSANVLKPGNKLIFKNCPSSKLCPSSLSCSPEKKIRDMG